MTKNSIKITVCIFAILLCSISLVGQSVATVVPTKAQLKWHDDEYYLFVHFGPNTFTNLEWGHGTERAELFNPEKLNANQWCAIAKQAGAVGIIITAKHHDGFCLWPSKYSTHTVRESKWRDGKGDVLKELAQGCKAQNLKFGVYLSPWDRNHPDYGTPQYNLVYVNMMTEIFNNYGPIWELWWDGANGEGPNGKKQEYDWTLFRETVKRLSPETIVFSDVGPHVRWVGNEDGIVGTTNWNRLTTSGFTPGAGSPKLDVLNTGNEDGEHWIPGEADVSIRPGWFYHKEEDSKVKQPKQLFNLYLKSVGRGANFLLNVPPNRDGLFTSYDSAALIGFKKLRDENFSLDLLSKQSFEIAKRKTKLLTDHKFDSYEPLPNGVAAKAKFKTPITLNCIELREAIAKGQQIKKFTVQLFDKSDKLVYEIKQTTIGHKRILTFPSMAAARIEIRIDEAKGEPLLAEISAYKIDDALIETQGNK